MQIFKPFKLLVFLTLIGCIVYLNKNYTLTPKIPNNSQKSSNKTINQKINFTNNDRAKIISVIDGDTLLVRINQVKEKVRLIGIDSPEQFDNEKAERDSKKSGESIISITKHGRIASKYSHKLLRQNDDILLEYDVQKRDRFGRLLAYVYLPDGTFVNEKIVSEGFARVFTLAPDVKYADILKKAENKARFAKKGLWSE